MAGYEERKREMAAVDYADLLVLARGLSTSTPACASGCPRSTAWCWSTSSTTSTRCSRRWSRPSPARGAPGRGRRPGPVDLLLARGRPGGGRPLRRGPGHARLPPPDQLPLDPRGRRPGPGHACRPATPTEAPAGAPAALGRAAGRGAPGLGAGRGRVRDPAHRRPDHLRARPGRDRRALPGPSPLGRPPARPDGGRRRVRALLRSPLRGERPRQGRAGVLPAAPQPARRAGVAPGAAALRPGGGGAGGACRSEIGGAPDPLAAAAALAPAGRRARGGHALPADVVRRLAGLARPEEMVLLVARSDWYRDHLRRPTPTGATGRATWRGWPSSPPARRASSASSRTCSSRSGWRPTRTCPAPPAG